MFMQENVYDMEGPAAKRIKREGNSCLLERNLNFSSSVKEYDDVNSKKGNNSPRDFTSHRIIEKRRRDRMNNCLADLSKLIPTHYSKQGQGRIEKTEVIEMAIKLIKSLQTDVATIEAGKSHDPSCLNPLGEKPCCISKFYMGFKECQDEVMRFLVESEDNQASDKVCVCMMDYLSKASKQFLPTLGPIKEHNDYILNLSSEGSRMRSRKISDSLSPSSTDGNTSNEMTEKNLHVYFNNRDVTSDSGLSNMGEAFSSMNLPLKRRQTEGMKSNSSRSHDFSSYYDKSSMSSCSGQNAYKFKHNITQRFSQQQQKVQQSDTSSSSSHEEHNLHKTRRRMSKICTCCSDSTPYSSWCDDRHRQTMHDGSDKSSEGSTPEGYSSSTNMYLPGFVLHPSGTHYFPFSIHSGIVPDSFLSDNQNALTSFHPITIPVPFLGPCISNGYGKQQCH